MDSTVLSQSPAERNSTETQLSSNQQFKTVFASHRVQNFCCCCCCLFNCLLLLLLLLFLFCFLVSITTQNCSKFRVVDPSAVPDRLVGLVVRRPPRERKIPGSNPACAGIFPGSSHTSDSKIGTPVATLPGAWRYRVSAGTGRPGVSIL